MVLDGGGGGLFHQFPDPEGGVTDDDIWFGTDDYYYIGYDQDGEYVRDLASDLEKARLSVRIVRMKPHHPERFKTSKLA